MAAQEVPTLQAHLVALAAVPQEVAQSALAHLGRVTMVVQVRGPRAAAAAAAQELLVRQQQHRLAGQVA